MYEIFKYIWNGGEIKETPLNEKDIKTYKDFHYPLVYNDPDFKHDLAELRNQYNDEIALTKDETDRRRYFKPLAEKWDITPEQVDPAYEGGELDGSLPLGPDGRAFEIDIDEFKTKTVATIKIDLANVNMSDFNQMKKMISHAKAARGIPLTRNRHPDDKELIYAVFKARMKGDTFSTIFRKYQNGALIGYKDKPTNNHSSADSLGRYYRRYTK